MSEIIKGSPIRRNVLVNASGETDNGVSIKGSDIMQPVDIQSIYAQTVQGQNGTIIAPSTTNNSSFIDVFGFSEVAITLLLTGGSGNSKIECRWSHDGVNLHGWEEVLGNGTGTLRAVNVPIKARYISLSVVNGDTVPRTCSVWMYLKA